MSGLVVEIEDEKVTQGATLEEMKAMEDHIESLENDLKETETEASIHDGDREKNNVAESLSTNADKKFDVEESLREDDKCLVAFLEESLSFKNIPRSSSNVTSNIFNVHHRNVSEMASLLVEVEVLKQVAIATSNSISVKRAHVFPLSTRTLSASALAALGLFLSFLKFPGP